MHLVHSLGQDFVAVLFYASWCPFSRNFRPSFSVLSSLYPSIPHFAIEESAIKPSILSKYGVHGFPTLFLLNSTVRVRYRGSRSLSSLVTFYSDVTGIKSDTGDNLALDKVEILSTTDNNSKNEPENCPCSWARSPENLLRQETYCIGHRICALEVYIYGSLRSNAGLLEPVSESCYIQLLGRGLSSDGIVVNQNGNTDYSLQAMMKIKITWSRQY